MEKTNKELVEFSVLANSYGMTYGQLQARETMLKMHRKPIDKEKYRKVGDLKKLEGSRNGESNR